MTGRDIRTCDVKGSTGEIAEQSLSNLATSGIASAKNQNPFRLSIYSSFSWGTTNASAEVAAAAPTSCAKIKRAHQ